MSAINVMLEVPKFVTAGLASGAYERIGGVVRDTSSKQVICWLREAAGLETALIGTLNLLGPAASILNLGISTATLALVIERTIRIEKRLDKIQETLNKIGHHVDIIFYANLKTALGMAQNALQMEDPGNRRSAAMFATNNLLQAFHQHIPLTDEHLEAVTPVADEYIITLFIITVAQVQCYLELEEVERARHCIQESVDTLQLRVERYIQNLLTENPAIYLQPALKDQIGLSRLTRIYRWLDPTLHETAVFEKLRPLFFDHRLQSRRWIRDLPQAIWDPKVDVPPREDVLKILGWEIPLPMGKKQETKVYSRLVQAMVEMETMIENYERFKTYAAEIQFMQDVQLSFDEWKQLKPEQALTNDADIVCIVPTAVMEQASV